MSGIPMLLGTSAGSLVIGVREVSYRRVERGHAYGGTIFDPPEGTIPYVVEDWLP